MIRAFNDPILKTVCDPVDVTNAMALREATRIADDMEDELDRHENGVGLAAPQAGYTKRIIILAPKNLPRVVMVNPEIVHRSRVTSTKPEGCLSYPGVTAHITRSSFIRVRYYTTGGAPKAEQFHGWHARIIQHEIDHLDGICRVGDVWRGQGGGR